jgi:hypothetical protein
MSESGGRRLVQEQWRAREHEDPEKFVAFFRELSNTCLFTCRQVIYAGFTLDQQPRWGLLPRALQHVNPWNEVNG